MAEIQKTPKNHTLTIQQREKIMATGIVRVDFFSDELITAQTDIGQLNIKGKSLHIENLSADSGDMLVLGRVEAVSYTDNTPAMSFFSRLFK